MANKPFAIQGSTLTIGGFDLQAGSNGVVIPGVTQAANYKVEEVEDTDDQTYNDFPLDTDVYVVDAAIYNTIVADGSISAFGTYIGYTDDEGYIDKIEVDGQGTYTQQQATTAESTDMYVWIGTTGNANDRPLVPEDWVQVPFRPKMRAGEVESIGGGGADLGNFTFDEDTITNGNGLILSTNRGTLAIGTNMETPGVAGHFHIGFNGSNSEANANDLFLGDDYNYVKLPGDELNITNPYGVEIGTHYRGGPQNVAVTEVDELVPPGGIWRLFISDSQYPNLGATVSVGDPVDISWGSQISATITEINQLEGDWQIQVDQDITAGFDAGPKTVSFGSSGNSYAWRFGTDGSLILPNGMSIDSYGTSGVNAVVSIGGDDTRITIDNNGAPPGLTITTNATAGMGQRAWRFGPDGDLTFPDSTVQTTAYTGQGGGSSVDPNVWVQTFVTDTPLTDFPQMATSVEYDADGNVIALFSHFESTGVGPDNRYFSVGKYTATGSKIWTVRFAAGLNTDGWGLAVDSVDNWIYIAGQTDGGDYTYGVSTLIKIDSGNGGVEWSKIYDFGFASSSAVVDVDSDGNPVMVGWANNGTDSYLTVTKIDKLNGNVTWTRKLDGQTNEQAYGMAVGPDGEIVAVGTVDNLNYPEPYRTIVTLTATPGSDPDWTTDLIGVTSGGLTYDVTFAGGVPTFSNIVDTDGNRNEGDLLVTFNANQLGPTGSTNMEVRVGTTTGEDMSDRMVVVKYASDGTIAWQKAIQFDEDYDCSGADADIDSNGNIYICGQFDINGGPFNTGMALVKFDSSGNKQWSRRVTGNCQTTATSIVVGPDDKLYISGVNGDAIAETFSWVVAKYSLDGLVEWQRFIKNTDSWTFAGTFFGPEGGGSNIAVRQGYVALAGGFGDLAQSQQVYAAVLQISDTGNVFAVGPWSVTAANLSGTLNGTASNIEVVNADLTDSDNALTVSPDSVTFQEDSGNFLIGTVYTAPGGNDSLVNGVYSVTLENNGTVTLPAGGTIKEGYVTSNPTIQLTPASPDVASQKLVIKGGGGYNYTDNGININYYTNTAIVGDTLTFTIYSTTYNGQPLYWWINPEGAGIGDSESGTVTITGNTGQINILIDSDDYEFTLRVSPEANNYDPASLGVESGLINASAPTLDADHHLHLTTGDLTETSIFLGTDDHNVRTTTDGSIQVTTTYYGAVASVASINSQGGYNTGTYTGLTTTGGTGSGLTVNATSNGGYIGVITVVNPGKGYTDDEVITLVGGDGFGCTFVINVPTGTSEWQFNTDGSITFPTLTTLDWDRRTLTGPTLQMGNDPTVSDAIITGPTPNQSNPNAVRLIIQGQEGWGPGFGGGQAGGYEGGDVYIWAGHGGEGNDYSGNGGDVKLRGGPGGLNGGYIRLESGDANAANGYGGFLDLNAGNAYNTGGYGGSVNIRAGEGSGQGGAVNIHTATTNTLNHQWTFAKDGILTFPDGTTNSGDTVISTSNYNIQSIGNTLIQTSANAGAKTWTFGADGRTTFPNGTVPEHSYGAAGDKEGMVVFSDPYIYYCKQDFVPNSTNVMTLASSGSSAWVSSTDYAGDLVADFTANSTGWTYNSVTLINISVDNQFGPGYLLEGVTGFSTINGDRYTLESPNLLLDIWVRVAWTGTNW